MELNQYQLRQLEHLPLEQLSTLIHQHFLPHQYQVSLPPHHSSNLVVNDRNLQWGTIMLLPIMSLEGNKELLVEQFLHLHLPSIITCHHCYNNRAGTVLRRRHRIFINITIQHNNTCFIGKINHIHQMSRRENKRVRQGMLLMK
jgi:hypothetical protein